MTRESEYDEDARQLVLERQALEQLTCERGHYLAESMFRDGIPWMESDEAYCMDCEAERQAQADWHDANCKQGSCRCHQKRYWVDRWEPVTEE